jgi:hypothetical protein
LYSMVGMIRMIPASSQQRNKKPFDSSVGSEVHIFIARHSQR